MSTKINRWIFVFLATLFFVSFTILSLPDQVSAGPVLDSTSNSCFTCHEDLYYLHDTGKSYCLTDHTDRCMNCHEGDATVMNKDASHIGLVTHPQKDDGAKCQQCHTEDFQARLDTFASLGGFKTVIKAEPYIPATEAVGEYPGVPGENQLVHNWGWLAGAIVLFGFWLVLVFLSPQKP